MNYSLENFENISFDEYDLDLRQKEVDGEKMRCKHLFKGHFRTKTAKKQKKR